MFKAAAIHKSENKFGLHKSENEFGLHKSEKYLAYLLYGSVASLPSPSSNIEAWPYGTSLRFAPAFRALGVCEHSWLGEIEKFIFFIFERTWFRFDPVSQSDCKNYVWEILNDAVISEILLTRKFYFILSDLWPDTV